jgi:hypothetical protein
MPDVLIAELESPAGAVATARRVRELGYRRVEAYTPFPIPDLDVALDIPRTKIPWLVLVGGLTGCGLALLIQWWTNAWDYPLNVGGRPLGSYPAWVPIIFETTVLLASFTAFGACLLASKLPRLAHPIFDLPGFERTSIDRFWIVIGDAFAADEDVRAEELATLRRELSRLGANVIQARLGEEEKR